MFISCTFSRFSNLYWVTPSPSLFTNTHMLRKESGREVSFSSLESSTRARLRNTALKHAQRIMASYVSSIQYLRVTRLRVVLPPFFPFIPLERKAGVHESANASVIGVFRIIAILSQGLYNEFYSTLWVCINRFSRNEFLLVVTRICTNSYSSSLLVFAWQDASIRLMN